MQRKLTTDKPCKSKTCNKTFNQKQFGQTVCDMDCAIDLARQKREEKQKKKQKQDDKEWKVEKAELIEKNTTLPQYLKRLQDYINHIARLIDKEQDCLMCGCEMKDKRIKKEFGCHYHAVGGNVTIRFHLLNIWKGCYSCNDRKGGNIPGYEQEILKHFGFNKLDTIKSTIVRENTYLGLTREDVKALIPIASKIVRDLEKIDLVYSHKMRWRMRLEFNKKLGIYK